MRLLRQVAFLLALSLGPAVAVASPGDEHDARDPAIETNRFPSENPSRSQSPDGDSIHTASLPGPAALRTLGADPPPVGSLHWQAVQNRPNLIGKMVRAGTRVDTLDAYGRTALMAAAAFGNPEAAETLLDLGADPYATDNTYGDTPLHFAARAGKPELVRLLLDRGVDPDIPSPQTGETPLHRAATFGHKSTITLLVSRGADTNAVDARGISPIHYASRRMRQSVVALLIDLGARHGGLLEAVRAEDVGRVLALIHAGADIDARDVNGTALQLAAASGSLGMAGILIDAGADLGTVGEPGGATPLHAAAINNHPDIVNLLLERGADPASRDSQGRTPLHVAAAFGNSDAAKVFLEHGADPFAEDTAYGHAPIHLAALASSRESVELLIAWHVDVNLRSSHFGETALHFAAKNNAAWLIQWLIANGADPGIRDDSGATPLEYARRRSPVGASSLRQLGVKE